jgi:hypothetical protein
VLQVVPPVVNPLEQIAPTWDNAFAQVPQLGGHVRSNVFLAAAKAYKDLGMERDSTQIAAVASRLQAQNREVVLIGCLVLTVEACNIRPNINSVGFGVWRIMGFDLMSSTYMIREQKVHEGRTTTVSLMMLRECCVLKLLRINVVVHMLRAEPGLLVAEGLRGLDFEHFDQNDDKVYHVRENEGAQHSVANIVVSSEGKSGTTVVKQGESSTESKSTVAAVMFDPNVMAVSKKILGTYSVPDVVSILKYGSQLTQSPTADTVVTDFCCNLDYGAVQSLLKMRFGDVRSYVYEHLGRCSMFQAVRTHFGAYFWFS